MAPALFRRHHGDPQPRQPCTVLLAGLGQPFTAAAIKRAAELAGQDEVALDTPVAVLTIAKVYGSSFGVQHPGLLPTKKEKDAQVKLVNDAIADLRRLGVAADGQVAVSRKFLRTIVSVAQAHDARFVIMDEPGGTAVRRWFEGDPARFIRPRLPAGGVVELVTGSPT